MMNNLSNKQTETLVEIMNYWERKGKPETLYLWQRNLCRTNTLKALERRGYIKVIHTSKSYGGDTIKVLAK